MRIISGKKRGVRLISPKNLNIRPTTDRIKEAMFDTLQCHITGANVLDLFCGSGALGIEAWSRGAKKVTMSDISNKSINDARKNLIKIGLPAEIELIKNNYKNTVKLFQNKDKFDIVIIDPPYADDLYSSVINELTVCRILNNDAIIVAESDKPIIVESTGVYLWKNKRYGDIYLTYFKYNCV